MFSLSRMKFNHRLSLLVGAFVVAMTGTLALSIADANRSRIGSAAYDGIILGKDLVADILPPPLYVVEPRMVVLPPMAIRHADAARHAAGTGAAGHATAGVGQALAGPDGRPAARGAGGAPQGSDSDGAALPGDRHREAGAFSGGQRPRRLQAGAGRVGAGVHRAPRRRRQAGGAVQRIRGAQPGRGDGHRGPQPQRDAGDLRRCAARRDRAGLRDRPQPGARARWRPGRGPVGGRRRGRRTAGRAGAGRRRRQQQRDGAAVGDARQPARRGARGAGEPADPPRAGQLGEQRDDRRRRTDGDLREPGDGRVAAQRPGRPAQRRAELRPGAGGGRQRRPAEPGPDAPACADRRPRCAAQGLDGHRGAQVRADPESDLRSVGQAAGDVAGVAGPHAGGGGGGGACADHRGGRRAGTSRRGCR